MKEFVSKLSLYETLSMLIPGSAILLYLILSKFDQVTLSFPPGFNNSVVLSIIWFVLAYIVGLIHNIIMDWWWEPFRNNPNHISFIYNQLKEEAQKSYIDKYTMELNANDDWLYSLLYCPCFLLRATSVLFVTIISPIWRLLPCLNTKGTNISHIHVKDQYFKAYYKAETRHNSPIISLEQQVAFMRNMLFPLILLISQFDNIFIIGHPQLVCIKALSVIMIICIAFCIVKRQEKIYYCVFEDAEYL